MKTARTLIVAFGLLLAGSLGAEGLWIHINVTETGFRSSRVEVNLPLRLIERLAPVIQEQSCGYHRGCRTSHLIVGHSELEIEQMRDDWERLQRGEEVTRDGAVMRLVETPAGETLVVRERDFDDETELRIPADVVDALLSGSRDEFDLEAAVSALARHGAGEIVSVRDDGSHVRIWIDENPEP